MSMRKIVKIAAVLLLPVWAMCSCKESTPDPYGAPDGIYFNNRTTGNALVDTLTTTFVYQPDSVEYIDVPVVVQSVGWQADVDRPVDIRVSSDNAVKGIDYELITPALMPAHASQFIYYVRVKKTEALSSEIKIVNLELRANEYFETFLEKSATGNSEYPYVDMLHYRIAYSNFFSTEPEGWIPGYVGVFSERKLRLLWKRYPFVPRENYFKRGLIPLNQWEYMASDINKYMMEQRNEWYIGNADEDALDENGDLLDFTPVSSE